MKIKHTLFLSLVLLTSVSLATPAEAQRSRWRQQTYDTQYNAEDSGRYRGNSALWSAINTVSSMPVVTNVKIPVALGVKVTDLEDTWGDARSNGRTHEGIDIMAPKGTPVVSPTDAVVTTVENSGNGGMHVFTANPGGERYYFAHLDSFATGLTQGQILKPGDLIGYVGNTGNASAGPTHLHFGMYQSERAAFNPFPRLTTEFTLQEKMDIVSKAIAQSLDGLATARLYVAQSKTTFTDAQMMGLTIPLQITQVLAEQKAATAAAIARTLKLGSRGDDVKALQASLGLKADGVFGPMTRAAVIQFQTARGLTPDGIFGPASRLALATGATPTLPTGCTVATNYSPLTGVRCR